MVQINDDHKIRIPSNNRATLEWQGETIDVRSLSDSELFTLKNTIKHWYNDQMGVIDDEINNWQPIYCSVCGEEDLAFRGKPFVTWGLRGGHPLCPRHTRAFDRFGTPEARRKQIEAEEEAEIKELFG